MSEEKRAVAADEGHVRAPVRLGDVTFDDERVTFHAGDVKLRSFRRDSLRGIDLVNACAAESPLRQALWGGAMVLGGCMVLLRGHLWPLIVVALGAWFLVHLFKQTSYVVLYFATGTLKISLDERFDDSLLQATGKQLRLLGYR